MYYSSTLTEQLLLRLLIAEDVVRRDARLPAVDDLSPEDPPSRDFQLSGGRVGIYVNRGLAAQLQGDGGQVAIRGGACGDSMARISNVCVNKKSFHDWTAAIR